MVGRAHPTFTHFEFHLEQELLNLQEELQTLRYQPGSFFTFEICDPKRRAICAARFRDRVVHHALCNVLEPATRLAPVTEGIPFLGLRIYPGVLRLNQRTLRRFRRQVRGRERAYRAGRLDLATLTQSVASLYAHVAHADTLSLRRQLAQRSLDLG